MLERVAIESPLGMSTGRLGQSKQEWFVLTVADDGTKLLQSYKIIERKTRGKVSVNLRAYTMHSISSLRSNIFNIYLSTQRKPLELIAPNRHLLGKWMAILSQEMKLSTCFAVAISSGLKEPSEYTLLEQFSQPGEQLIRIRSPIDDTTIADWNIHALTQLTLIMPLPFELELKEPPPAKILIEHCTRAACTSRWPCSAAMKSPLCDTLQVAVTEKEPLVWRYLNELILTILGESEIDLSGGRWPTLKIAHTCADGFRANPSKPKPARRNPYIDSPKPAGGFGLHQSQPKVGLPTPPKSHTVKIPCRNMPRPGYRPTRKVPRPIGQEILEDTKPSICERDHRYDSVETALEDDSGEYMGMGTLDEDYYKSPNVVFGDSVEEPDMPTIPSVPKHSSLDDEYIGPSSAPAGSQGSSPGHHSMSVQIPGGPPELSRLIASQASSVQANTLPSPCTAQPQSSHERQQSYREYSKRKSALVSSTGNAPAVQPKPVRTVTSSQPVSARAPHILPPSNIRGEVAAGKRMDLGENASPQEIIPKPSSSLPSMSSSGLASRETARAYITLRERLPEQKQHRPFQHYQRPRAESPTRNEKIPSPDDTAHGKYTDLFKLPKPDAPPPVLPRSPVSTSPH